MTTNEIEAISAGGLQGIAGRRGHGEPISFGSSGWQMLQDRERPFYGTRLGLERTFLSDGRSVIHGRLVGRRLG